MSMFMLCLCCYSQLLQKDTEDDVEKWSSDDEFLFNQLIPMQIQWI